MLGRLLDESYPVEVRRNTTTLTVARLWANSCYRFSAPFLATIARGLDVSLGQLGVALAMAELAGLLSPLTARLVDRLGQRAAMIVGLGGVALGTTAAASSTGWLMFGLALVALSQSKVLFDLGLGAWISGHVAYERRSTVFGLTETSWALGLLLGVSTMGLVTGLSNWRVGYLVAAVAVVIMAGVLTVRLPHEARPTAHQRMDASPHGAVSVHGWFAIGAVCSLMAASQCLFVTFGSWLEDDHGFTATTLAAMAFALGFGELAASITSARRTDRWGKQRSAAAGAALMVPSAIVLAIGHSALAPSLLVLVIAIIGFEFAIVSALPLGTSLVPGSPARGLALMIGAGTLGRALVSIPATSLYENSGIVWPAAMCAGFATVTAAAMLVARP